MKPLAQYFGSQRIPWSETNVSKATKWYFTRDAAKSEMIRDLRNGSWTKVVFLGVSHQHLVSILHQVIAGYQAPLPWRQIDIIFAREDIGIHFERNSYLENVRHSRRSIAEFFSAPSSPQRFPQLTQLNMYIEGPIGLPRMNSGCLLGRDINTNECEKRSSRQIDYSVGYVVEHLVADQFQTEQMLTFRVDAHLDTNERGVLDQHVNAYEWGKTRGKAVAKITLPSLWDASVVRWAEFEQKSLQLKSMEALLDLAKLDLNSRVLDVGAGAGYTSRTILSKTNDLTIIDGSPQMVAHSDSILTAFANSRPDKRVRFAMANVPTPAHERLDVDIEGDRFHAIISHFSIHTFCPMRTETELRLFAEWCKPYLLENGRVWIATHNTFVDLDMPYDPSQDRFRTKIREEAEKLALPVKQTPPARPPVKEEQVVKAFEHAGFGSPLKRLLRRVRVDLTERCLMWRCPAILADIVDFPQLGRTLADDEIALLVRNAADTLSHETVERGIVYLGFQLEE